MYMYMHFYTNNNNKTLVGRTILEFSTFKRNTTQRALVFCIDKPAFSIAIKVVFAMNSLYFV